jgi:hypothetical protein
MAKVGSFEFELISLRKFVLEADDDALIERYFFYVEYLSKLRFLIRTVDTVAGSSNELATDLFNEQRWGILVNVCEVELKRRGLDLVLKDVDFYGKS